MRKLTLSLVTVGFLLGGACVSGEAPDDPGGSEASGGSAPETGSGGAKTSGGRGGSGGSVGMTGKGGAGGSGMTGAGGSQGGGSGGASMGSGGSAGAPDARAADVATAPDMAPIVADPNAPCPRCVKIFNGMNFDGWHAASTTWSIVGGAMRGIGGTSRAAYTKEDYGNVRLFVTSRMAPQNGDHLGILFWGNRPADPNKPQIDNAGWVQWMPPFGGMWSYHPPMHHGLKAMKLAPSPSSPTEWHTSELLLNLDRGTLRVAVNGIETTRYTHEWPTERTDPTKRIIKGPLAMMKHGGGGSEYKDIWVEAEPTEDKLYSVKAK